MKSIIRISTADAVVNFFKEEIIAGRLVAGSALPSERLLTEQFGISRFSLREGLARLNALGIINIIHGKGAFVADHLNQKSLTDVFLPIFQSTETDIGKQLFEARFLIETEIAVLACERRTEEDIYRFKECIEKMKLNNKNSVEFAQADYDFHFHIAECAHNIFLKQMHNILSSQLKPLLEIFSKNINNCNQAILEHEMILESIVSQKPLKVRKLIQLHLGFSHSQINKK